MIVTYLRSSSYNTYNQCEHRFFLDYILRFPQKDNLKAVKGTIVHKVLELLALQKLAIQQHQLSFDDEHLGIFDVDAVPYQDMVKMAFGYYDSQYPTLGLSASDMADCKSWVEKVLQFHGGEFHPGRRNIVAVEQEFDLAIPDSWAKYNYTVDKTEFTGQLAMKGTIDLITEIDNNTLEMIDWKTGKRIVFPSGEVKDLAKLQEDPQLQIYFWAMSQLFPQYEHIIITIYYVNDGGPFSLVFSRNKLPEILERIKKQFLSIQNNSSPKLSKGWWCKYICAHGQNNFETCHNIRDEIEVYGIDRVTSTYTAGKNVWDHYKAPGSL